MNNNYLQGNEAREKLFGAVKKCADIIGGTMGTGGYNVLIQALENPGHLATNDGITALENIHFKDPIEQMGKNILLEAVKRSNKAGGDGSSTTTVLTAAILEEGEKYLSWMSPMEIKRSLEEALVEVEEAIKAQTTPIAHNGIIDLSLLEKVATVSAEDATIGKTIADIYSQIGIGGIIHWDISKTFQDHYTIGNGITVDGAGFTSPYFADIDEKTGQLTNQLRWREPKILITKQKITTAAEFEQLFVTLNNQNQKEVVIFCDEFEPVVIGQLVQTRLARGFKAALVKMPTLFKDWWYIDLAKATGATVIDGIGVSFKTMNATHLGSCQNIVVDKENTYIDGILDVSAHVQSLLDEDTDDSKLRASRLNTKTARYFVGAPSDSALAYRRLKVEDAVNTAYYAIRDGVVPGGGIALLKAAKSTKNPILKNALKRPFHVITENAGIRTKTWLGTEIQPPPGMGYDTRTKTLVHMHDAGILDSASIMTNAVRNAISVAAAILTCEVVIQFPQQSITDQIAQELLQKRV